MAGPADPSEPSSRPDDRPGVGLWRWALVGSVANAKGGSLVGGGRSREWRRALLAQELLHLNDLPALRLDHLRCEEPDVRLGGMCGGVLRHRQAALVMAQHQLQEVDIERFARQRLELVYLGWSGHSGHETVGGQLFVAVHPSHDRLARGAGEVPDV